MSVAINWPYLAFALLALWFPRQWLRVGRFRRRRRKQRETLVKFAEEGASNPEDKSVRLGRELKNPRNYLDFFRALAGAVALWSFSLERPSGESAAARWGIAAAVLLSGLLIQTIRRRDGRTTFAAAIFYAAGMSIGMGNYFSGAMAFLLVAAINPIIPNPRVFLAAYALLLLPFNSLLGGGVTIAVMNSAIILVPVIVSLLANRPMVIFARRAAG
jgi:hypothetical protein